jgi:PAS domain S-box-containing protein
MVSTRRDIFVLFKVTISIVLYSLFFQSVYGVEQVKNPQHPALEKIDRLNELSRNNVYVDNLRALKLANEALELSLVHEYLDGQAFAFRNMSAVYSSQFSFVESIKYIKKALDIFEASGNLDGIANCNISLGHTFGRLGLDSVAFEYHKLAYDYFEKQENRERKAITSHNLGQALFLLKKNEEAIKHFFQSLEVSEEIGDYQLTSSSLSYLGEIAFQSQDYISAENYFKQSKELFTKLSSESQKYATLSAFYHLGMIDKVNGDLSGMLSNLLMADKIISENELYYFFEEVYEELISFYKRSGDLAKEEYYASKYTEIFKGFIKKDVNDKSKMFLDLFNTRELEKNYVDNIKVNEINNKLIEANNQVISTLVITMMMLTILLTIIINQFFKNKRNLESIRFIYDNAGIALVLLDSQGRVVKWNKFSDELFGETSEKVLGKNFFREFVSKGNEASLMDLEREGFKEFTIFTKDHLNIEVSLSCSRSYINSKSFYILFILDWTEFKRVQRSNDFYRTILERSNKIAKIGTWEVTYSNGVEEKMPKISQQVFDILEIDKFNSKQLNDIHWKIFFKSRDSIKRLNAAFQYAINHNKSFDLELEMSTFLGKGIDMRLIGNVEFLGKDQYKFYGTMQDITEIKNGIKLIEDNLMREQELNKLKSRFISMASHEFRVPLSIINSSVELIQMKLEKIGIIAEESTRKHTLSIVNQIKRLENTLDGILLLEKTTYGKMEPTFEKVDLEDLFKELIDSMSVDRDPRVPKLFLEDKARFIVSDEHLLYHIFQNIVSNSLKYSKGQKEPEIYVRKADDRVIVEIIDYGIGIPDSDKSNLFESFYRASNSIGVKGTGLGLSIVKEFTELIGASVSIESKEGEGTKVSVILPDLDKTIN